MLCPNCKKEIADGSQFCPECGTTLAQQAPVKQKKPITKKWWFWVIIVVVAIALFSAVGGGSDTPNTPADSGNTSQGEEVNTTKAPETTTSRKTNFSVGETLNDGDLAITYAAAEVWTGYDDYSEPKAGNKIIRLKFEAVNNGDSDTVLDMFDCYADDVAAESYYYGDESLETFITLSSGRKTSGWIYFEVPENAQTIEVEYEVNMWSDEKVVFVVDLK